MYGCNDTPLILSYLILSYLIYQEGGYHMENIAAAAAAFWAG